MRLSKSELTTLTLALVAAPAAATAPSPAPQHAAPGHSASGHSAHHPFTSADRVWCANVVLPQARAFHVDLAAPAVHVAAVRADIVIVDGVATTTLDVSVTNPTDRDAEAELLLPVPADAVVSGFDFEGKGADSSAVLLPRDEAKRAYDSIVARLQDPALLEFAGAALVRSSVFPVPSHGRQVVRVKYEEVLPAERCCC